jgi:O-antigen biosynthesis protein
MLGPKTANFMALLLGPTVIRIRRWIAARGITGRAYRRWIRNYELSSAQKHRIMADEMAFWPSRPLVSILMPVCNANFAWLRFAIESVRNQVYQQWELCISADVSKLGDLRPFLEQCAAQDSRIRVRFCSDGGRVSVNWNNALELSNGNYVALLDAHDCLSNDALFWTAREIALHADVDLLFSDEDKIGARGRRSDPYFKPAWNMALMLSQNAFSHLGVFRRRLVEEVGRFRQEYEGAEDYDLVLRCAAKTVPNRIRHIPRILYHRRTLSYSIPLGSAKTDAWEAGRLAIADFLQSQGTAANITRALKSHYRLEYKALQPVPLVSIIVPSTLSVGSAVCLQSVLNQSTYKNFELLVVARSDHLRDARGSCKCVKLLGDPRLRVVEHEEATFNFSRVINLGAASARGSLLCLLNDDVAVITQDWLEHLVARVQLDGIGAVGPMLYHPNNTIQHAGMIVGAGGVADHVFAGRCRGHPGYFGRAALEQDYSCLTGACLLVKRSIFDEVGGLDEAFPIAFNDTDLCLKIRRAGARIVWTPTVEMYHHESLTIGRHNIGRRREQFLHDFAVMRDRWKNVLNADPCYNPNLSLVGGLAFTLAWPPREPDAETVVSSRGKLSVSRTSSVES